MFAYLQKSDSLSLTRAGDTIRMPAFWSYYLLKLNLKQGVTALDIAEGLQKIPYQIHKCSPNYLGEFLSFTPNDPAFQNGIQKALCDPSAGIKVCDAWDNNWNSNAGYKGSSDVNVGHFDTGLRATHVDFNLNGTTKVAAAYDFYNGSSGMDVPYGTNSDVNGHGTETASIYAAITNNGIGIAGVAGGDAATGNAGCTLYGLNMADAGGGISLTSAMIFEALVKAALQNPITGANTGYGVDIANHSYAVPFDPEGVIRDGVIWCFRNGITTVAGSGNTDNTIAYYPASLYDDWVIKVGGHDESGNRWVNLPDGSTYGNNIDLSAPASNTNQDYIAYLTNDASNSGVDNVLEGTSFSAPFVTGAAALIYGYIKNTYTNNQITQPEDIEHLLEYYAKDAAAGHAYTNTLGWGLLDIGAVFSNLSYPKYKVQQFKYGTVVSSDATLVASSVPLTLEYSYSFSPYLIDAILPATDMALNAITYTMDVYKVNKTASHSLLPTESIITTNGQQHAWILNSMSELFGNYDSANGTLRPEVNTTLSNVTNTSADIEGYVYHVTAASNDPTFVPQWIPFDILSSYGYYAYSLHTVDAAINSVESVTNGAIVAFPNPADEHMTVMLDKPVHGLSLNITDIAGRTYYNSTQDGGSKNFTIDIKHFPNGVYLLKVQSQSSSDFVKFVVSH